METVVAPVPARPAQRRRTGRGAGLPRAPRPGRQRDLPVAAEWYKRTLAVEPELGDAYYEMACVYALQGEKVLALRYLQIAALDRHGGAAGIDAGPGPAALRDTPAHRALVKAGL